MALGTISSGLERFGAALGGQLSQYDDVVNRGEQAKASNALAGQQMAQNAEQFEMQREQLGMKRDMMQQEQQAALSQERKMAGIEDSFKIKTFLDGGNVDHAIKLLENRVDNIMELGGDPSDSLETLSNLKQGNIDEVYADVDAVVKAAAANKLIDLPGVDGSGTPSAVQTWEHMIEGLSPQQQEQAKMVRLGLAPAAKHHGPTMAEQIMTAFAVNRASEEGKIYGKEETGRGQEIIKDGMEAVEGLPLVRRTIDLLGSVKTGGFNELQRRAKSVFGVTGRHEAELMQNLNQAWMPMVKQIFGGAPSKDEVLLLKDMSASGNKGVDANRRLMQKAAVLIENRAKRALSREKIDKESANDIKAYMRGDFDITEERLESVSGSAGAQPEQQPAQGGIGIKAISIR